LLRNKKYILLLLLLSSLTALAQPRLKTPEIYIGVHGGVSASSILFTPAVENMTPITQACVLGGNGGLVFRYSGHKCCAVQVELNYQHRGWREHSDAGTYSRELHYLELPLLMNIYFGSERWRGFFNLGPQIGYCVKDEGGSGTQIGTTTTQYAAPIDHPFDWGLAAGLGFYYRSRNAGLYQFETRFSYSFGGIYGTSLTDHFSMASPMDLSINLAWMWEIKKKK
jgi:hypothetical protein